jgi:hypothetical protein
MPLPNARDAIRAELVTKLAEAEDVEKAENRHG